MADFVLRPDKDTEHKFTLQAQNGFSTSESVYAEMVAKQHATEQNLIYLADRAKNSYRIFVDPTFSGVPSYKQLKLSYQSLG